MAYISQHKAENQNIQFFKKLKEQCNVFAFGVFHSGFVYVFVHVIVVKGVCKGKSILISNIPNL